MLRLLAVFDPGAVKVPAITEPEKQRALDLFRKIDAAVRTGPFISYLFCLEYILKKMGRDDVCLHLNQIQCPKRREAYQKRLDTIFDPNADEDEDIMSRLRRRV